MQRYNLSPITPNFYGTFFKNNCENNAELMQIKRKAGADNENQGIRLCFIYWQSQAVKSEKAGK